MEDKESTLQLKMPTMRNRKHKERTMKKIINGKLFLYFLLTFLCAGFEISVVILFCLSRSMLDLCNHRPLILVISKCSLP